MMKLYNLKLIFCLTAVFFISAVGISQKNFAKEADNAFMNESFYSAIELYKKAEVKEKKPAEKKPAEKK